MFDFFKSGQKASCGKLSSQMLKFLEKADESYMVAFSQKSTRPLSTYMSRDCAHKLSTAILSGPVRYFGNGKFRNTEWTLLSEMDGLFRLQKTVTFDKVRVSASVSIGMAEGYTEIWIVQTQDTPQVIEVMSAA